MPSDLRENVNDKNHVNSLLKLFDMNQTIRDILNTFDFILDDLLNVKINSQEIAVYQTNFDMSTIHEKILNCVKHECKVDPPNIIILESGRILNSNEDIFEFI